MTLSGGHSFGGVEGYLRNDNILSGFSSRDIFGQKTQTEPDQNIVLTDIMPNAKFHVPVVKAPDTVNTYQGGKIEVTDKAPEISKDVENVAASYMQADMEAKAKIVEAIHEVAPDKAGAMVNHIFPRDQAPVLVDMFRAAATISGPVGNAYEILNSILKENKAPEKGEIAEVLEKALTQLHKQGEQAKTQSFGESAPKPQPQKFDFSEIKNAPQLLDFIQRDPLKDPVMQQVQDARKGVEAIADNENHKREIVAQQAETRANFNAFGVQLTGENLAAMPRVTVPQQIAMEPNEDVVAALKNSKIDEPENKIEAPLLARTAMLGMAAGAL